MSARPISLARRRWLEAASALAAVPCLPAFAADPLPAFVDDPLRRFAANPLPVFAELTAHLAGRTPRFERLVLDLPRVADNGNAVPMKVSVPGPFEPGAQVRSIALFAERNPYPKMAEFEFAVPPPRVEIESRVRLAGSQRVVAVATMSDGVLYAAFADVSVTFAACYDGT